MIDPAIRQRILDRLAAIEAEEGVRILLAVESGSRAWGFPSPDSDYDVRFLYARPRNWYLSIRPGRDVIERPIEDVLDIGGWDLRKALGLLAAGNPALLEWLSSPILYRADAWVLDQLRQHADLIDHRRAALHHYGSLAERQYSRLIAGRENVELKKYFYALRPALALRWLRLVPQGRVPMAMSDLLRDLQLPEELAASIAALIERKRVTRELGEGPRVPALDALIEAEVGCLTVNDRQRAPLTADLVARLDQLFLAVLDR